MLSSQMKTVAVCSSVLYIKFLTTNMIQGGKTFKAGTRPPEDSGLMKGKHIPEKQNYGLEPVDEADKEEAARLTKARAVEHRWRRMILNDLENIPISMLVFISGALVDANPTVHMYAMGVFTAARIGHSFSYAYQKQPHRAYCWGLAVLASLVGVGNVAYTCLTN